jgi:hypothetical protein
MLEHADRDDPVESLVEQPVIDELELHAVRDAGGRGALASDLELVFGEGDPEHVDSRHLVQEQRHPAPAAADVEHALARLERELGGDVRLLVELRLLQGLVLRVGPVSAAVLLVGVEEEVVELVTEVVMMGDILARAAKIVGQQQPL